MAYEWEREEWRDAVRSMSEVERHRAEYEGKITAGDPSDAIGEDAIGDDDE